MTTARRQRRKRTTAAKISISLPPALLRSIDKQADMRGETRSEFIREAVERVFREEQQRKDVEQWLESYRKHPQTEEEVGWAVLSLGVLEENPWDDTPASESE